MKFSDSAYLSYEVYALTQPRPSANVPASQLPAETVTSEPIIAELTSYLANIPNRPLRGRNLLFPIFACLDVVPMYVHLSDETHKGKLQPKSQLMVYLGTSAGNEHNYCSCDLTTHSTLPCMPFLISIFFQSALGLSHTSW